MMRRVMLVYGSNFWKRAVDDLAPALTSTSFNRIYKTFASPPTSGGVRDDLSATTDGKMKALNNLHGLIVTGETETVEERVDSFFKEEGKDASMTRSDLVRLVELFESEGKRHHPVKVGYVGEDVESILYKLFVEAGCNLEEAQRGIVYIDEIDKMTIKIFEWMDSKKIPLTPSQLATYVDLIAGTKGLSDACDYFEKVDPKFDNNYGTMMNLRRVMLVYGSHIWKRAVVAPALTSTSFHRTCKTLCTFGFSRGCNICLAKEKGRWSSAPSGSRRIHSGFARDTISNLVVSVRDSFVHIEVESEGLIGSRFLIDKVGTIVTSAHCVSDDDSFTKRNPRKTVIKVTLNDGRSFLGKVEYWNFFTDIATVRIYKECDRPHSSDLDVTFQPAQQGILSNVRPGDWAIAMGSPIDPIVRSI